MSGFDTTWLDLREPVDHAARDATLLEAARAHLLAGDAAPLAVDLGSGTGSTLRAFGPSAGAVRWRLVDHDPRLLGVAAERLWGFGPVERVEADLAHLSSAILDGARLATASALFDLASRALVDRLAGLLAERRIALYAALNYDGATEWDPQHPADPEVLAAFNAHQTGDKGLGPALGPGAAEGLREAFEARGYTVRLEPSPWRLGPEEAALRAALLAGFTAAAGETGRVDAETLRAWHDRRARETAGSCRVGHIDVLALPPRQARRRSDSVSR